MIEPVTAQVPLMVAVGNHEYDHEAGGGGGKDPSQVDTDSGFVPVWGDFGNDSGGECGVPTAKRFTMPATGNGVFWYSYDYGLVHTVVISSEHDLSAWSPQHIWLEHDLRKTDRLKTPWVVVETHRPFYEGEKIWKENSVGVAMRLEMEDLLYDYNVDLVVAGHYHAYHRTYVH
jgi:acid phosphatase type 7